VINSPQENKISEQKIISNLAYLANKLEELMIELKPKYQLKHN
jgi:hypothetical protein